MVWRATLKKIVIFFLSHSRILQVWEKKLKSDSGTQQMGWISLYSSNRSDSFLKRSLSVMKFFIKSNKYILRRPTWEESIASVHIRQWINLQGFKMNCQKYQLTWNSVREGCNLALFCWHLRRRVSWISAAGGSCSQFLSIRPEVFPFA